MLEFILYYGLLYMRLPIYVAMLIGCSISIMKSKQRSIFMTNIPKHFISTHLEHHTQKLAIKKGEPNT